jgi:hypothetical protein
MLVDAVAPQPVDENENERTIEEGLDQPGEKGQAMDSVGDKSGDAGVDVGAEQMMQVDGMLFFFSCWIFFHFYSLFILFYFYESRRGSHCSE